MSVVLPTHDRAALLARSAGSVLSQSFRDLELIVVDDGSTQDVAGAVRALGDPRARVLRLPARVGGAAARNAGVREARAPLLAFQDSDDEWLPGKLEAQVAVLRADPAVGVVYCPFVRFDGGKRREFPKPQDRIRSGDLHRVLLQRNIVTTAAVVVRRTAFDEAGGFDPEMKRYQDWDLWIRVARQQRFACLDEAKLEQHHQADSISAQADVKLGARLRLLSKYKADMARYRRVRAVQLREVAELADTAGQRVLARRLRAAAVANALRDALRLRARQ